MPAQPCPLCSTSASVAQGNGDYEHVKCPRCGTHEFTGDAVRSLEAEPISGDGLAPACGMLRESAGVRVTRDFVARLRQAKRRSVSEQAERILILLSRTHRAPGARFQVDCSAPEILGASWAASPLEVEYLVRNYLVGELGALDLLGSTALSNGAFPAVMVTPRGWAHLDALSKSRSESALGFIAMWFDPSLDRARDEALMSGIADAGYEPKIISQHEHLNRIDDEIVALIRRSRFLVADFTGNRGGVYFEAGFAHGLGLPVVWTCRRTDSDPEDLHFDVNHFNFIFWSDDQLPELRAALSKRIESVVGRGPRATS